MKARQINKRDNFFALVEYKGDLIIQLCKWECNKFYFYIPNHVGWYCSTQRNRDGAYNGKNGLVCDKPFYFEKITIEEKDEFIKNNP